MATLRPTRDYLMPRVPNLDDADLQKVVGEQAEGLQGLLNELRTRLTEVADDPALSEEGKAEKRREAVRELREVARRVGMVDRADKLATRAREARGHLYAPDVRLADDDN